MPDRPQLAASDRDVVGKNVARLRKQGRLPAVVYGHGRESRPVTIDAHEFDLLRRHAAASSLVDLSIDGARPLPVIVQGVQRHRLTQRPLHVDLFAVRMSEEMVADIPLVGSGEAPAVEAGGTLVHQLASLKVKALPAKLPEALHYDLAALVDFDATITVADVALPDGVSVVHVDPAEIVAKVLAPRVAEHGTAEEALAAAEAGTEAASATEGEAAGA